MMAEMAKGQITHEKALVLAILQVAYQIALLREEFEAKHLAEV
jgi:hypothetical protein